MPPPTESEDDAARGPARSPDPQQPQHQDAPARPSLPDSSGPEQVVPGELLRLVLTTATVEAYLDELVHLAARASPTIAGCGITLRRGPEVLSVAVSNPLAGAVDEVQYGLGQGPCLSALDTGEVVAIHDMSTEQRFGSWPTHARSHGVLSSLSIPLRVAGTSVGALNTYFAEAHGVEEAVRIELLSFAAQAEVALALTLRAAQQSDVVDQLHAAMETRSVIDQALGILMARQRCSSTEAFAALRGASQARNRKIVDIAADLITTATGNPPQPGRFQT